MQISKYSFLSQKLAAECVSNGFSGTLIPYKCDLSVVDDMLSMFSWIKVQHQGIDVCINNAGLALPEPLLSGKSSGWMTMMDVCNSNKQFSLSNMQNESWPNVHILQVNVIALSVCTREAYQSMKERQVDDGHIININRYRCILLYLCSVYSFSCLCSDTKSFNVSKYMFLVFVDTGSSTMLMHTSTLPANMQ